MKVYVTQSGEYSDYSYDKIFLSEEKAKLYCAMKNTTSKEYWYEEENIADNNVEITNKKPVKVYKYTIDLNTGEKSKYYWLNEEEGFETITDRKYWYYICRGDCSAFSTLSYEHAKKIAIEQYQIYTQNKLESEE